MTKYKVIAAMSGGVDSAVAALLLKNEGHTLIGVTLKLFAGGDDCLAGECGDRSASDAADAKSVCRRMGIPHDVFDCSDSFQRHVMDRFADSYNKGFTPNPCVDCNRFIKFGELLQMARRLDFEKIATGHYARVEYDEGSGRYLLKKALDHTKDQSYALYCLTQEQLAATLFPLGGLEKARVREIALENGLINAKKRDSQDICFVPDGDYYAFLKQYLKRDFPAGAFLNERGETIGTHGGIAKYTVGQRKGLGVPHAFPLYVKEKNLKDNTVTLCPEDGLYRSRLIAGDINLIAYETIPSPIRVTARTRYRQKEQPARLEQVDRGLLHCEFDQPQRAIAKGQAAVFYQGDLVVGGGTIL